ncbi:hypothetical protein MRX96_003225 [Rhipicephalus microplus]
MHWSRYVYSLSCLLIEVGGVNELHTSTIHLQEGLVTESLAFEDLSRFLLSEQLRIRTSIDEFQTATSVPPRHDDPLTKFVFASRLGNYCETLTRAVIGWQYEDILRSLPDSETLWAWWPMSSDLKGAAEGVCKLQQVYDVPVRQMVSMRSNLLPLPSPNDLKDVARGCFTKGRFGNSTIWSKAALRKMRRHVAARHGRRFRMGIASLLANKAGETAYPLPPGSDMQHYKSICVRSGDVWPLHGDLVCQYSVGGGHPHLLLQPLKVEFLSYDPRIVVLHDFVSAWESQVIRNMGAKNLVRGTVYTEENPSGVSSPLRISKVSWLSEDQHPLLANLARRIAATTGLSLESAELYQVANYGLGGHYTPHPDAKDFGDLADEAIAERPDGNRLATMLLFLSDVSIGGATAPRHFDFWHEKKILDTRTWHTGCPVLRGSKWIATKWIHERGNIHVDYDVPV